MNRQGLVFGLSMSWSKVAFSIIFTLLMALSVSARAAPQTAAMAAGTQLAAELTALYEATPSHCENDLPAYRCSGVIARGTRQTLPEGQGAWEPYPRGWSRDTSFSFLRADIKMKRLAWSYTNGFIIAAPDQLAVDCFFPIDAVSDQRDDKGCGPNKDYRYGYSLCEALLTLRSTTEGDSRGPPVRRDSEEYQWTLERLSALWLKWDELHAGDAKRRCAYSLKDADATQRFEIALAVAAKVSRLTELPNDLKIQTWDPGYDPRLPIRAFFYVNDQGKPFAVRDRERFEQVTKIHLPVLKVTFPGEREGNIKFEFVE